MLECDSSWVTALMPWQHRKRQFFGAMLSAAHFRSPNNMENKEASPEEKAEAVVEGHRLSVSVTGDYRPTLSWFCVWSD